MPWCTRAEPLLVLVLGVLLAWCTSTEKMLMLVMGSLLP